MHKLLPLLSIGYSVVLTILSLMPQVGPSNMPSNSDKVFHAIAYMFFTMIWYLTLKISFFSKKALRIAIVLAIVFGIIIEILQHTLTQHREADIKDVIANIIGTFLSVLIIKLALKMKVKNN
ncbi:VanZ family protein [Mesoflavibacter zeaxanthinifaciens]|uniref:VanZ family protein n=1 Tax=Mesoflavibacter zeaxanthinifaciens TaxID=393060 RepID=UPI0006856EE3|nr:VanZ family protein [Mesoflavibacter zeaxanthinifaciens]